MNQRDRPGPRTTPKRRTAPPTGTDSDRPAWVRERRPWDVSPANWRYFLGGGIAFFLLAATVTAVVLLVIGRPLDERVMFIALLAAGALVGTQWFGAVRARQVINGIARRHDVPGRPLPGATVLTGTVVIGAAMWLAMTGLIAGERDADRAGAALAEAIVPAALVVLLLFLLGRRTSVYVDEAAVLAELHRRSGSTGERVAE